MSFSMGYSGVNEGGAMGRGMGEGTSQNSLGFFALTCQRMR